MLVLDLKNGRDTLSLGRQKMLLPEGAVSAKALRAMAGREIKLEGMVTPWQRALNLANEPGWWRGRPGNWPSQWLGPP